MPGARWCLVHPSGRLPISPPQPPALHLNTLNPQVLAWVRSTGRAAVRAPCMRGEGPGAQIYRPRCPTPAHPGRHLTEPLRSRRADRLRMRRRAQERVSPVLMGTRASCPAGCACRQCRAHPLRPMTRRTLAPCNRQPPRLAPSSTSHLTRSRGLPTCCGEWLALTPQRMPRRVRRAATPVQAPLSHLQMAAPRQLPRPPASQPHRVPGSAPPPQKPRRVSPHAQPPTTTPRHTPSSPRALTHALSHAPTRVPGHSAPCRRPGPRGSGPQQRSRLRSRSRTHSCGCTAITGRSAP